MASTENPIFVEAPPEPAPRDPVWSGRDVVVLVLVAFFTLLLCGLAIGIYLAAFHSKQKPEEIGGMAVISVVAQTVTSAGVLLAMYWIVARRYRSRFWSAVHWTWPPQTQGVLCALGGIALALLVERASQFAPLPRSLPIYRLFGTTAAAWAMAAYGMLIAPLVEELFFRGFLYPVLARRWGMPFGVLLTSFAFMIIHTSQLGGAWIPLLFLFTVGALFTLARALTGSVAVSWVLHTFYNGTLFTGLFLSTGYFRHMERLAQ